MVKQSTLPSFNISRKWFNWTVMQKPGINNDTLPPEKRLRVGIIGGGDIGLRNANSVNASQNAMITAVCDKNHEVLKDLAKVFDVPATSDYENLLTRKDVDAVLLSIPHKLHGPMAIQAAKAGKHVMLEKPMGVNLEDATRIVEACRQAQVRLTVNFSFRYTPAIQVARQMIQDEALGEICSIQINQLMHKGASYWAGGFTARAPGDWRGSKEGAGGGILIMNICHAIDYIRYSTELEVKRIFGEYGTYATQVQVEDTIFTSCQYSNGAIGSITASSCWYGTPIQEVRIWGTHGAITIIENSKIIFWSTRPWQKLAPAEEYIFRKLPQVDYTAKWINNFAIAVANGEPHEITAKDGWINNAIMDAAYSSQDKGQTLEVSTFPWTEQL